ncbi:hypothetical protein [Trinickia violacea]|uniref:hypothetical protein n=1 Tax=Trinickia violacea TaxID=2571746 RepID=UPI001586BD06|nr:hypothetical protein [Trinickia violacea]
MSKDRSSITPSRAAALPHKTLVHRFEIVRATCRGVYSARDFTAWQCLFSTACSGNQT